MFFFLYAAIVNFVFFSLCTCDRPSLSGWPEFKNLSIYELIFKLVTPYWTAVQRNSIGNGIPGKWCVLPPINWPWNQNIKIDFFFIDFFIDFFIYGILKYYVNDFICAHHYYRNFKKKQCYHALAWHTVYATQLLQPQHCHSFSKRLKMDSSYTSVHTFPWDSSIWLWHY